MFKLLGKIIGISGKYKWRIYVAFIFSFIKSMLMNTPIFLSFVAITSFLEGKITPQFCLYMFLGLVASIGLQAVFQNIADRLQSAAGYMMFADLRNQMGEHLRRMPMGYFTEGNIGKISSVLSTDMVFVEENCMVAVADMMSEIFAECIMVLFLFFIHLYVGLLATIVVFVMMIIGIGMQKEAMEDSANRQQVSEQLTDSVLDFIEGIGIIKTYNMIGERSKKLSDAFTHSCSTSISFEKNHTPWQRRIGVAFAIGTAAVIALGYYLYTTGSISLSYYIGILLFAFALFKPIQSLYSQIARLTVMSSCVDRMQEVFDEPELMDKGKNHLDIANLDAQVEKLITFEDVSFGYGNKEVLHNISFDVKKNTMTALVGPSGGGKSTIANLIARFWDVSKGDIKIGGLSIKNIPLSQLMDNISMVFQRVYLFEDTIYNNIAIGRPNATREEIVEVAKKARCYDFIMALPDGFDTVLSEGGSSLSGGEKQRISIARCILKDTPIIILDEATASVDVDNETYIQEAITELCKGKTLIVIAHRLNTIVGADNILVIKDGRVEQQGKHEELIRIDGTYKNFVNARSNMISWSK